MGQNRKIWEGQSNDVVLFESESNTEVLNNLDKIVQLEVGITEKELIEDSANERRLFFLQIGIMTAIILLAILREVYFPSDIAVLEFIRESFN